MASDEAILAKLAQILERLEALESLRTEQVVIENGEVHIYSGQHAPVLIAQAGKVQVRARRGVSMYVGGDLNGEVKTKEGKLRVRAKGNIGAASTETGELKVTSKKGDVKLDIEAASGETA